MRALPRRIMSVLAGAVLMLLLISGASFAATGSANPMQVFVTNTANDPVPVSGTVQIGNIPATQPVSGTVSVDNLPATQEVTGTVGIDPGANAVSVDLSAAKIETTPAETTVLLDEVVTLENKCEELLGCGPLVQFSEWRSFPADQAERVHLMAYGAGGCDGECPKIFITSVSPSDQHFPMGSMEVGDFGSDRKLLELPGTTVSVQIVYRPDNVGMSVHLYAVGR